MVPKVSLTALHALPNLNAFPIIEVRALVKIIRLTTAMEEFDLAKHSYESENRIEEENDGEKPCGKAG